MRIVIKDGVDTKDTINKMLARVKDTHRQWVCVDALVQHGTDQLIQVTLEDKVLLSGPEAVEQAVVAFKERADSIIKEHADKQYDGPWFG